MSSSGAYRKRVSALSSSPPSSGTSFPELGREWQVEARLRPPPGKATASWISYTRDHVALLDDDGPLVIKDKDSQITILEPRYHVRVVRMRGPSFLPVICERWESNWSRGEISRFGEQALRVVGTAKDEARRPVGPYEIPHISTDGRTIAAHIAEFGVVLIDATSGRILSTYALKHKWRVVDLAFSPDGRFLVMAGFHPQIHDWRLRPFVLAGHRMGARGLAFARAGPSLASAADDATIKLWNLNDGHEQASLEGHGLSVTAVAYSPDGSLLASAGSDRTVLLRDLKTRQQRTLPRGHSSLVRILSFSPNSRTLATGGDDRTIRLWDVAAGRELPPQLVGHTDLVSSLAFAPDGTTLYSGSLDGTIRVWDCAASRPRTVWNADGPVCSLAIAPDDQTLALGYPDGAVRQWDVITQKRRAPLSGHTGDVLGLTFSPDGLTLASAGQDRTVRLWEPITGQELMVLKGHVAPVQALAFSPDSVILASGSHDGAIRLWRGSRDRSD